MVTHAELVMTQKMALSAAKNSTAFDDGILPLNPFLNNIGRTPYPGSD
jgi:hypothetical protein